VAAIPPINASLAASSAINPTQTIDTATTINFGAGYIDTPNSTTTIPTATPTATSALGNAASDVTPGGVSLGGITKTQGEWIAGIAILLFTLGLGAWMFEKGHLK